MIWKLVKRTLLGVAFLLLLGVTAVVVITVLEMPPKAERQYMALRWEWDEANRHKVSKEEAIERDRQFLVRCTELADKNPKTPAELATLLMADDRSQGMPERELISKRLCSRIENANFKELLRTSGYGLPNSMSADVAAQAVFARVKSDLDQPMAPFVLSRICGAVGGGSEAKEPPALVSEIAELILNRFANSKEISNFCALFGNGSYSPPWAWQFEKHLKEILEKNEDRSVKLTASMALAEIAHNSIQRQAEAEKRYRDLLVNFDGKTLYRAQSIEEQYRHDAILRLESMQYAPIGRLAPEIIGLDIDGQPMKLSEFRGKVVVMSFWATWCGPCMKLIPHERELAERFAEQPFVIVGVNADDDPAVAVKAASERSVTWRSFRDKGEDRNTISSAWSALFPTVYVIDHEGIVRHRFSGNPTPSAMRECIEPLVDAAAKSRS